VTGDGMRPTFRDELQRIDRLLTLVHARDIAPVRGVLTYHDLLVVTCRSLADLGEWLESDPGFLPRDWNVVRCDVKREASLRTCASIASGRIGLILTRPPVRGGAASARRHPGEPPAVQYYVDASDPADPYGGAEVDALLEDARAAWHGIVNRHWMDGLFGRNEL
jgi:hypothetical protein